MTPADRDRLVTLKKAQRKLITQREAAEELGLSTRQVKGLLYALKEGGDKGVQHGLRGRRSNRRIDDWTTGDIHLWGACLQQGNDPKKGYARTWASQMSHVNAGLAAGPTVIAAPDSTTSPLKVHGPGSNLADGALLDLTADREPILAGGSGSGYRFAELAAASNPSGWSCVIELKTPAGTTLGYILLYSNP